MMRSFIIAFALLVLLAVAEPLTKSNVNREAATAARIASSSSIATLPTAERAAWNFCRKWPKWCCKKFPKWYTCRPRPTPEPWVRRGVDAALDGDEGSVATTSRTDAKLPTAERTVWNYCRRWPKRCCRKYPRWYKCKPRPTPEPWVWRGVDTALDAEEGALTTTSRTAVTPKKADAMLSTSERAVWWYCRRYPSLCCKRYPKWYKCKPRPTPEPWVWRGVDAALEQSKPIVASDEIKPAARNSGAADLVDEDAK